MNSWQKSLILFTIFLLLSACGVEQTAAPVQNSPEAIPNPTSTPTSAPPTPTPIPMAVMVNGEGITLEMFTSEIERFTSAQAGENTVDQQTARNIVLQDLIAQTLLAQAAEENDFTISDQDLDEHMDELVSTAGGDQAFNQWLQANYYTMDTLRFALERSLKAAWMRDQILAEVPETARHIHLRQIFLLDGDQANQILFELDSGRDFATIAAEVDPVTRGDLGWIPRNYLPHKEIEEVVFSLQPGDYSQVIQTDVGFHIIQVEEVEEDRQLNPDARLIWQELALRDWMELRQADSNIEILVEE
jgi:peptidyl-prolyl cis-trans isomerase C